MKGKFEYNLYDMIVFEKEDGSINQDCVTEISTNGDIKYITCSLFKIALFSDNTYKVIERGGIESPWFYTNDTIIEIWSRKNKNTYKKIFDVISKKIKEK